MKFKDENAVKIKMNGGWKICFIFGELFDQMLVIYYLKHHLFLSQ